MGEQANLRNLENVVSLLTVSCNRAREGSVDRERNPRRMEQGVVNQAVPDSFVKAFPLLGVERNRRVDFDTEIIQTKVSFAFSAVTRTLVPSFASLRFRRY